MIGQGKPGAPPVKKPGAPVQAAAAAASGGGSTPTHVLKYKDAQTGKYVTITNLFTNQSKDGSETYLKGTDRETQTSYFIMTKKPFEEKA